MDFVDVVTPVLMPIDLVWKRVHTVPEDGILAKASSYRDRFNSCKDPILFFCKRGFHAAENLSALKCLPEWRVGTSAVRARDRDSPVDRPKGRL